jgi:DNA-binding NarL/FixJ family response regulator
MQILIADDNAMVRRGVKLLLSSRPEYTICGEAGNGDEAVSKAKQLQPDLILLDISMPGSNGLVVAARLRRELPAIKIIIMSQHDMAQIMPSAVAAGADACLDKDNLGTDLLSTIAAS